MLTPFDQCSIFRLTLSDPISASSLLYLQHPTSIRTLGWVEHWNTVNQVKTGSLSFSSYFYKASLASSRVHGHSALCGWKLGADHRAHSKRYKVLNLACSAAPHDKSPGGKTSKPLAVCHVDAQQSYPPHVTFCHYSTTSHAACCSWRGRLPYHSACVLLFQVMLISELRFGRAWTKDPGHRVKSRKFKYFHK